MAYKQEIIDQVRGSYIYQRLSLEDAARKHKVPYGTARTWKTKAKLNNDDWDTARNAARMAAGGLGEVTNQMIENFAIQSQALIDMMNDKENPVSPMDQVTIMAKMNDSYTKLVAAVGKSGSSAASLGIAMTVLEKLGEFIRVEFPDHNADFLHILKPFGNHLAKEFS